MDLDLVIEKIVSQLQKNGFPGKKVSFPVSSIKHFVEKYDYELDAVLHEMEDQEIFHLQKDDRLVFSAEEFAGENKNPFGNLDPAKLRQTAEEWMKHLTPDQISEIQQRFANLSPKEKTDLFNMAKNMGFDKS